MLKSCKKIEIIIRCKECNQILYKKRHVDDKEEEIKCPKCGRLMVLPPHDLKISIRV